MGGVIPQWRFILVLHGFGGKQKNAVFHFCVDAKCCFSFLQ